MIRSEDDLLALIDRHFARQHAGLRLGRGDDCAELPAGPALALSTDLFLEDAHFRRSYFEPEETGHKALAVNLSDLAAAGAVPAGFSLGLICVPDLDEAWYDRMFGGMAALANNFDLPLSGGDISMGEKLGFSITVWGRPAGEDVPFLRRGGVAGQKIFVVGKAGEHCSIGLARKGLLELEAEGRIAQSKFPASCQSLLKPWPQIQAGSTLARLAARDHAAVGLMDLSDGLMRDLPRLLGGFGAELDFEAAILHPELGGNALELALSGGDDYLLLGTAGNEFVTTAAKALGEAGLRLDVLGSVTEKSGLRRGGKLLKDSYNIDSFDHFSS